MRTVLPVSTRSAAPSWTYGKERAIRGNNNGRLSLSIADFGQNRKYFGLRSINKKVYRLRKYSIASADHKSGNPFRRIPAILLPLFAASLLYVLVVANGFLLTMP